MPGVKRLMWVDTNDLRPGARPLLVTERADSETRTNETTVRGSEIHVLGPSVLRFDPNGNGLARVWLETEAGVRVVDEQPAYRQ